MAFIVTVSVAEATGEVAALYEQMQSHFGYVPNYAKVYSHNPPVMIA